MGFWLPLKGQLASVTVGDSNHIWGFSSTGQIYQYNQEAGESPWVEMAALPGANKVQSLSVGSEGTVFACDSANAIYKWNPYENNWIHVPVGEMVQINVGDASDIFGIDKNGAVWQYTLDGTFLKQADPPAKAVDISVGNHQSALMVGDDKSIYRLLPPAWRSQGAYRKIEGIVDVAQIAQSDESHIVALDQAGAMFLYAGVNYWNVLPFKSQDGSSIGTVATVAIGDDGTMMALSKEMVNGNNVFQYIPGGGPGKEE